MELNKQLFAKSQECHDNTVPICSDEFKNSVINYDTVFYIWRGFPILGNFHILNTCALICQ
jgi:hypothetical protein